MGILKNYFYVSGENKQPNAPIPRDVAYYKVNKITKSGILFLSLFLLYISL